MIEHNWIMKPENVLYVTSVWKKRFQALKDGVSVVEQEKKEEEAGGQSWVDPELEEQNKQRIMGNYKQMGRNK